MLMFKLQYFSRSQIGTFSYWQEGKLMKKIIKCLQKILPDVSFTQPKIRYEQ